MVRVDPRPHLQFNISDNKISKTSKQENRLTRLLSVNFSYIGKELWLIWSLNTLQKCELDLYPHRSDISEIRFIRLN